jgi:hypothetical protein
LVRNREGGFVAIRPGRAFYDEHLGDLDPSAELAGVQSVKEKDADHGFTPQQEDSTVEVPTGQLVGLSSSDEVRDGVW